MIVTVIASGDAPATPWLILVVAITALLGITSFITTSLGWGESENFWKGGVAFGSGGVAALGFFTAIYLLITMQLQHADLFVEAQRDVLVANGYSEVAQKDYGDWIATNQGGTLVEVHFRRLIEQDTFLLTETPVDITPDS